MSGVITTGFANVTKPSSLTTSSEFTARCSLVSTKYPSILAAVLLILGTDASAEKSSSDPPNYSKVSTNFPAVIGFGPQIELLV